MLVVNGKFLFVGSERKSDNTEDRKEAMKLYRNSSYPGIHLQKDEKGKGFCHSHLHVRDIEVSLHVTSLKQQIISWTTSGQLGSEPY